MRISSSQITMASSRSYTAEASEQQTTIARRYDSDGNVIGASATSASYKISQMELEAGTAVFSSSDEGLTRVDENPIQHNSQETKPLEQQHAHARNGRRGVIQVPGESWLQTGDLPIWEDDPKIKLLKKILELLEQFTGKKSRWRDIELPDRRNVSSAGGFRFSASAASVRYQETVAMLNSGGSEIGDANAAIAGQTITPQAKANAQVSSPFNGQWTRQTIQSGFIAGEEHTAFRSSGTVVTADGRTIDFGITLEMSRSFEAAYVKTGQETVYTDPLVINLNTNAASLADVSFFFDLNADGTAEEMSALDGSSGFLALDKNGDGEINDGTELFGARTGDGFAELAQYDEDGNGWIDEDDSVYSQLSVWVKCGSADAELLSLKEADVGAIFLGSQNTQFALEDDSGETGAMIRKTGLYLKENGQVGTVQHVDFKA